MPGVRAEGVRAAPSVSTLLTAAAGADLEGIRTHTEGEWGETRWLSYFAGLVRTFETLAEHPRAGRARDELGDGVRSMPCQSHVVFYVVTERDDVVVLRILHGRQEVGSAFGS